MDEFEIFQQMIKAWAGRKNPVEGLTLAQLANITFRDGSNSKASLVGRVLNAYRRYFTSPSRGGYKWSANWSLLRTEHPGLFPRGPRSSTGSAGDPRGPGVSDVLAALDDEKRAVRERSAKTPLVILGMTRITRDTESANYYEALYDEGENDDVAIPEGCDVQLRWVGANTEYGELLASDPIQCRIVIKTARPLPAHLLGRECRAVATADTLVDRLRRAVERTSGDRGALVWKVLGGAQPKPVSWDAPIIDGGLDSSQRGAVRHALSRDVTLLWGPPGTGKTHTLARIMASLVLAGERVMASAIANVAVDQLALQVVDALRDLPEGKALLDAGKIVRFGFARQPKVLAERRLFPDREEAQRLRRRLEQLRKEERAQRAQTPLLTQARLRDEIRQVETDLKNVTRVTLDKAALILTTVTQVSSEEAIWSSSFSTAVMDEASMASRPHLLAFGGLVTKRFIVAGDFRQLGPIVVSQSEQARRCLGEDLFKAAGMGTALTHPALQMLTCQRRMHDDIASCINTVFYGGRLTTAVTPDGVRGRNLQPFGGKSVVFVDLERGGEVETTKGGSRKNYRSGEATVALATMYLRADLTIHVGIVTPYRAQARLIKNLIKEAQLNAGDRITVGTVHAYQGSEADIILWDLVESQATPIGRLFRGDDGNRLCNVAISRAKGKLVMVGELQAFRDGGQSDAVGALRNILFGRADAYQVVRWSEVGNVVAI